jgi:peptide/nickel transport system permease protein
MARAPLTQAETPATPPASIGEGRDAEGPLGPAIIGRSPWRLAWRRLRRNYVALGALGVFVLILVACMLAPVYAHDIAHTTPNANNVLENVKVSGHEEPVISSGGFIHGKLVASLPIGPTWFSAGGRYVLGADQNGRDVAVRLLYGGQVSLQIGIISSLICVLVATLLSLVAGYYGGWVDFIISRFYDLFYAFPVVLLGIALGAALAIDGLNWGPIHISGSNLWITTLIIAYVLIPYVGRPLRGQVLLLRQREFVEAAIAQGARPLRIMFTELLPNMMSSVLVFFTLTIASNIVFEAGLSYLGAGVQPPNASWGTLISDGQALIITRPWLSLAPGIAIILTVLSLNIFGDGLRDALDPHSTVKVQH